MKHDESNFHINLIAEALCNSDGTSDTWDNLVATYGIDCFACCKFRRMAQAVLTVLEKHPYE